MIDWKIDSWRKFPIKQVPEYSDMDKVASVEKELSIRPPLVFAEEARRLRKRMADVAEGKAFLLQGGDCAESFAEHNANNIRDSFRVLLQMAVVLTFGSALPVIKIGRLAGQYSKPRSSPFEVINDVSLPSYRGDIVNGIQKSARDPDPGRLISAYHHSAATLNYARALVDGGFADLHHPHHWDLGFVRSSANRAAYEDIVDRIRDAIDFVESTGVRGTAALKTVELFCSHEGLLLDYEAALTEPVGERWYNLGAHFLWIGDRTRQLDGAHVEYFRGLENPIGIKAGPSMAPADLVELITTLEPANRPGRITVITRLGAKHVAEALPHLVETVQAAGRIVTWVCDPMHGNTVSTDTGLKTRDYDAVLAELEGAFAAHEATGSRLGGVHFELTGEDVTECTGGPQELSVADLSRSYETYCDPRLNYAQSLELALRIAQRLQGRRLAAS